MTCREPCFCTGKCKRGSDERLWWYRPPRVAGREQPARRLLTEEDVRRIVREELAAHA